MTDGQLHLIARILDSICADAIVASGTHGILVQHCRYCGAIGTKEGDRVRYEHPDECVLSLNAQLQETIKQYREEQTTVDEPTNETTQATDTTLLQKISERAQQGLDQGVILAREAYAALRDIIEMCKEG